MKTYLFTNKLIVGLLCLLFGLNASAQSWIRVNQVGYLPKDIKKAIWLSKENYCIESFQLIDFETKKVVYTSTKVQMYGRQWSFNESARLDFSDFMCPGRYQVKVDKVLSPPFGIGSGVYAHAADIPLHYMRSQRCGYNPILKDSCHRYDGRIVCSPQAKRDGEKVDVRGGWHDASDYLQYVTTSANAVYQMLFAYRHFPKVFGDFYDEHGDVGSNGIPDVLDEAKWGLDWLIRMNPDSTTYFNQLADDRDHRGFTLPNDDKVDYGWGAAKERPVYCCSGEPQGLRKYKNRSTGLASTLGKYASSFALGAQVLRSYYPEWSKKIENKAKQAYRLGSVHPGVCQTACCVSPYFYEEDNWADDMELAATTLAELYPSKSSRKLTYLKEATNYGRLEPVTPWMGADSARHYQWYPFVNLGHYKLAKQGNLRQKNEFIRNMRSGLRRVLDRAQGNVFLHGIPFIWCSNNLTVGLITQCHLYREMTQDTTYQAMETAMRDWLLGCNPWGKSMIVGYPEGGDFPKDPHSAFTHLKQLPITGGLVDGPIYTSIFGQLRGLRLSKKDEYAMFQSNVVVYHDDYGDYSTNEPTMDGTASLCYYLASLANEAQRLTYSHGAIVRGKQDKKQISLVFTGHEFLSGFKTIRRVLHKKRIKASFFFTGDFYRKYAKKARKLQREGHYLGAHSDKHLLYVSWKNRNNTLVSRKEFEEDLENNYKAMKQAGLKLPETRFFLPAYEWYNDTIANWCRNKGCTLINFTSGTRSNADYTLPTSKHYCSANNIFTSILSTEAKNGMNGFILLLHAGVSPERKDLFAFRLAELIEKLQGKGYAFVPLNVLLEGEK